ncbi:hypothetical protein FN846DRAFT_344061 [Sphaerosporella brunnea]|uniref:Uncharacterized protein n=1 Tax=Sphaerosporella brunnea TaxID=1250544 RepID=A0A5J5EHX1_9PEZI|nr:hypothetical protein FN846DRAFT_344061 [Sphaerosporella brunnea]
MPACQRVRLLQGMCVIDLCVCVRAFLAFFCAPRGMDYAAAAGETAWVVRSDVGSSSSTRFAFLLDCLTREYVVFSRQQLCGAARIRVVGDGGGGGGGGGDDRSRSCGGLVCGLRPCCGPLGLAISQHGLATN